MKLRFSIFVAILVLVILAVVFWRRPVKQAAMSESMPATEQLTNVPVSTANVSSNPPASVGLPTNLEPTIQQITNPTNYDTREPRELRLQQIIEGENVPINFWGQVVDQDDQPVPNVRIVMIARHPEYVVPESVTSTNLTMEMLTDAGGRFEWTGGTGDLLSIESVVKDGYLLSLKAPRNFAPSSGNYENPVIIKMWKESSKESLISGSHVFGIDSGKVYTLDLISGRKIEGEAGGDLKVIITRPPDAQPRDKYQWSFSIEAVQGGLIESDDEFMFLAPQSGYQPTFAMQLDPSNPTWSIEVPKQFFIRTRDGRIYGRIQVNIYSIYNVHSAIEINYTINPNSSRNLQP